MIFRRSLIESSIRAGLFRQASRVVGSGSGSSKIPHNCHASSGLVKNIKVENVSLPYALSLRNYIHSGKQAESEAGTTPTSTDFIQGLLHGNGNDVNTPRPLYNNQPEAGRAPRPMDYGQGFLQGNGNNLYYRRPFQDRQMEANADVVHMKLMRNNCFITVTDSKGNKKLGTSAGRVAGKGGKLTRYSADAAAEDIGRKVRQMKTKSVVVKVNGFTFFRKKKQAILSFKDGYSNSRGNMNPVVYIEDTTRKPHNGCRLPKKRRI
ncbi:hypothetical protein BUALT_Bualt05G0037000 [Buddleja alternifolia]|uniref:Ribosomal protein S11 n=1 Tax=Buddleja alternifolia TaxID=168488 RepID=A0AAV6XSG6_9LAMI|nr:hypothetical protein BUALT_Bualt05G0037000 [Buddleja alternifolia]